MDTIQKYSLTDTCKNSCYGYNEHSTILKSVTKITVHYIDIVFPACPPFWTFYKDNCYKLETLDFPITWTEAQIQCKQYNSNLTSIMSEEEMVFIHYMAVSNLTSDDVKFYIGMIYGFRTITPKQSPP